MGLPQLKHPGYTLEDWQSWDGRWELINGVAYDMTPAPSLEHQRMSSNLHARIWNALEECKRKGGGGECELFSFKRWAFEAAGVQEYLIVDPDERVGVLLRLEGDRYQETARVPWGAVVALLGGRISVTLGEI